MRCQIFPTKSVVSILSLCCDGSIKEVFADFVKIERITGEKIAEAILTSLAAWDLPLQNLRGQCYGSASNMAGARSGCSAIAREKAPLAIYHHCAAHCLNLTVVSVCKITAFRNTGSYIGEMVRCFQRSDSTCLTKLLIVCALLSMQRN